MAAGRVGGTRRDFYGHARHDPLRDAASNTLPPLAARRAPMSSPPALSTTSKCGRGVAEIILISLRSSMQRIDLELATVQPRRMARIDAAFQCLQPVALLQALGNVALLGRHGSEFPFRRWRLQFRRSHIGPQHVAAFRQRIGLELDLLAEAAFRGLRGHLDALPGHIILPAMIGAAQAIFLIAADPKRGAAMGAELVDQRIAPRGIAPSQQPFAEELHAHRRAVRLGQFAREQRRDPIAAEQLPPSGSRGWFGSVDRSALSQHRVSSLAAGFRSKQSA